MLSQSLISDGKKRLADAAPDDVDGTNLRHASEHAYYAMFHAICESATETIRANNVPPASPAYRRIYRSPQHALLRRAPGPQFSRAFDKAIVDFITTIAEFQIKRETATYDPIHHMSAKDVAKDVAKAESLIAAFLNTPTEDRHSLLHYLSGRDR